MAITSWLELGYRINNSELRGQGADKVRGRRSVNEFCSWADTNGVPFPVSSEARAELLDKYLKAELEGLKTASGDLNKDGKSALSWAEELMKRSLNPEPAPVTVTGAVAPPEDKMAKTPHEDTELENDDGDIEEELEDVEDEDGEEEELEEEEPPKRRRAARGAKQQPIIVQLPPGAGRAASRAQRRAEPTGGKVSKLLRGEEKVRIFKRDERGKRIALEDYTLSDIGNMSLHEFIEEVVHPRFQNDPDQVAFTDYMVFQVDPRTDAERPPASTIRIDHEDNQPQAQGNDPFQTVHRAVALIDQLNHRRQEEPQRRDPAFAAIREKAASSGDLTQLLMLTMMERLFSPQQRSAPDADLVMKLVDRLDRLEGKGPSSGVGQPPWAMMPPMAPPPPQPSHVADRVMELAVAQMVKPPPSLLEQAKELATVKQVFGGGGDESALRAELQQLRQQLAGGKRGDGFTDAVESFEKIVTTVKNIAPQIGAADAPAAGGGFAGFIRGMLTPEVGKAIAGAITGLQQQGQPQQPAQAQKPAGAPQQTAVGPVSPQANNPPPRDPNMPPNPLPPRVAEAVKQFRAVQTPAMGAEKLADFVVELVLSGDPYYTKMLEPAMNAMQAPEVTVETLKPVRALGMRLIMDLRPEWAKPEFVDAAIAALAAKNGTEMPKALTETRSRWTMLFDGSIMMLDTVAKEVPAEPAPVPVPEPAPAQLAPGEYPRAVPTPIPPDRVMRAIELEDPLAEKPKPEPVPAETPAAEVIAAEPEKAKPHRRR